MTKGLEKLAHGRFPAPQPLSPVPLPQRAAEFPGAVISAFAAWCGTGPVGSGGLLLGLFLAGAAGSTMHCVPMCGGFVLGQVADGMAHGCLRPGCASGSASAVAHCCPITWDG